MSTDAPLRLPTFLILGAQNSARWLRNSLAAHPAIHMPSSEPGFFSSETKFAQGAGAYADVFAQAPEAVLVGEMTPAYMLLGYDPATIARRIDETLPGVRLYAMIRHPVDRLRSAFVNHRTRGRIPADADLLERVRTIAPRRDPLHLVSGGWYGASLAPYVERFGSRLHVVVHDDVVDNPTDQYRSALAHLDLGTQGADHAGLGALEDRLPPLSLHDRAILYSYYRDDVRLLERLLGRSLERWRESVYIDTDPSAVPLTEHGS